MAPRTGSAELQGMLDVLKTIPEIARKSAPDVADVVRDYLKGTASAGTSPIGQPWLPRKADGKRALADAADAIRVGAVGTSIVVILSGPEALHHRGGAKGGVRRQIIPTTALVPPKMARQISEVLTEAFETVVRP
jgi:hypothetical protein